MPHPSINSEVNHSPATGPVRLLISFEPRWRSITERPRETLTIPRILKLSLFLAGAVFCQTAADSPSFEVASVKRAGIDSDKPEQRSSGGHVVSTGSRTTESPSEIDYQNTTLMALLMRAYDIKQNRIVGPDWLDIEHYDIVAKLPSGAPQADIPLMLQNLIKDRFALAAHWKPTEQRAYELVLARTGQQHFKSTEAGKSREASFGREGAVTFTGYTFADFADVLAKVSGQPVIDKTQLPGTFELVTTLDMARLRSPDSTDEDRITAIIAAVRELGLKLDSRTVMSKSLVIDRANKIPTEN